MHDGVVAYERKRGKITNKSIIIEWNVKTSPFKKFNGTDTHMCVRLIQCITYHEFFASFFEKKWKFSEIIIKSWSDKKKRYCTLMMMMIIIIRNIIVIAKKRRHSVVKKFFYLKPAE